MVTAGDWRPTQEEVRSDWHRRSGHGTFRA